VIPLDDECVAELSAIPVAIGRVFPFPWLNRGGSARPLQRLARLTGIPIRMHGLRHNAATALAAVNPLAAQQILGHKDLKTTRRYVHFDVEHLRGIVEEAARRREAR